MGVGMPASDEFAGTGEPWLICGDGAAEARVSSEESSDYFVTTRHEREN